MQTKNKARDAATYVFTAGEKILVDANIWLYLAPPPAKPTQTREQVYTQIFASILQSKAEPVVDALVLSEYFNRYLRVEYHANWQTKYGQFKAFRQSNDALPVLQNAVAELRSIQSNSRFVDTSFSNINIPELLNSVQSGAMDFNDAVMLENCRVQQWKLLTNDADMTHGGIEVLTINAKLLRACP